MDAFRLALDETWRWAERRGVRVDFWKNDDQEWEAMVTLNDGRGDFSASMVIPVLHPNRAERRKHTVEELQRMYVKQLRGLLDGMTANARIERKEAKWRRGVKALSS